MLTELIDLPGGSFRMGSTSFYPDEGPIHSVTVGPFAIERHPVTNAQYAEFVADTVTGLLTDDARLADMTAAAALSGHRDAAEQVAKVALDVARAGRKKLR